MSLQTEEQLIKQCKAIMLSRSIRNKIVVLCEGGIPLEGQRSPSAYRQQQKMPDANFYTACIPGWWKERRPEFFPCGDKKDVLDTYFKLLELHHIPRSNDSYLDPNRLFAMVDLDLQIQCFDKDYPFSDKNYPFPNIEAIFKSLYQGTKVNRQQASQHRIWVTGLIYKEAYFLIPELQPVFDDYSVPLTFNSQRLQLENIYLDLGEDMDNDANLKKNLKENLTRTCDRISYCTELDCSSIDQLKSSWLTQFQSVIDQAQKDKLIYALLMIKQVKDHWHKIRSDQNCPAPPLERLREQLTLAIGRFYAKEGDRLETECHIPIFFKTLYQFV